MPRKTKMTLLLKAHKVRGGYKIIAENGDKPFEDYVFKTKKEAYMNCKRAYPINSVWKGKKVNSGFRIYI